MATREKILGTQLRTAAEIWREIQKDSGPADHWLANYFFRYRKTLGSRDRKFLSEITYTLFRHKTLLEAWASQFKAGSDALLMGLMAAASENILSLEDFEREVGNFGMPREQAERLFGHLRQKRPPVLKQKQSPNEEMALRFSFPLWLVERWSQYWNTSTLGTLLGALNDRPPLTIRTNTVKISREKLVDRLNQKEFHVRPTEKSPLGIVFTNRVAIFDSEEFREGLFEVQDEGSQLAGLRVNAQPGELIWDVCAGGGGKALLMAGMMKNKGRIVATDIRMKKLGDLKKRAQRAGIFNIFPADLMRMDEIKIAKGGFDKIVVDAPCSGTGTLRRNPDAKWKLTPKWLEKHHADQVAIIESALPRLKPGGTLFYITCSLDPYENEKTLEEVLAKHPELIPLNDDDFIRGFFHLDPARDNTDGFFVAALRKQGSQVPAN